MNFIRFYNELINLDLVTWITYENGTLQFYLQNEYSRVFKNVSEWEFEELSKSLLT